MAHLDFTTLQRRSTPNDYLVAPENLGPAATDTTPPVFSVSPNTLFETVLAVLQGDGGYQDIRPDAQTGAISAVAVTRLLRFKDDVDFKILPSGDGATLAIYSRSRLGAGDLGANRKRVESLLSKLSQRLPQG